MPSRKENLTTDSHDLISTHGQQGRSLMRIHSFPPVSNTSATRLILGSMPGKASLAAQQYYAHPRNVFWQFMSSILNVPLDASYKERCRSLMDRGVAVWDVLKICERTSSLDSDIDQASMVPNDFEHFLSRHANIDTIFFNGAMAETSYLRHVRPALPVQLARIRLIRLPSTSPANASIPLEIKLKRWTEIKREDAPIGAAR